jgi:nucleotide-binding universal stress UspA family protein
LNILLAVDGSKHAERALSTLKALQLPSSTNVTLVTVVHEHAFLGGISLSRLRGAGTTMKRALREQEQQAKELLQRELTALGEGVTYGVDTRVRWGRPAEQILGLSQELDADLVIVGAKGLGNSKRFPLGTTAQKVMKYADTSVLLAKEDTSRLRRVVVATDGSEDSKAAARFLLDLPLPLSAKIFVVTSLESHMAALLKMPTLDIEANQEILSELRLAEEKAARSLLTSAKRKFQERGYGCESLLLRGDPAEEIIAVAKTLNPDLITVGAKGLNGIERFLMGSVAQRVARFSRYSVLIARPKKRRATP